MLCHRVIWTGCGFLVLLLLCLISLLVIDFRITRRPAPQSAIDRQLVGRWVMVQPEGSLQNSVLIFHPDGWVTSRQQYGNRRPEEYHARWHTEGSTVVYQETQKGLWSAAMQLLDRQPREELKIVSISDSELRLGQSDAPIVFLRSRPEDE